MPKLLRAADLTGPELKKHFDAALMITSLDDDDNLTVRDPYNTTSVDLWVGVNGEPEGEYVRLLAFFDTRPDVPWGRKLAFADEVNRSLDLVRAALTDDGDLLADHFIYTWGGITTVNLMMTVRHFMGAVSWVGRVDGADAIL